jgi:hypothetical protein
MSESDPENVPSKTAQDGERVARSALGRIRGDAGLEAVFDSAVEHSMN